MHLHLGRSKDGASLDMSQIQKAMDAYGVVRGVIFAVDEKDAGPVYEKANDRLFRAARGKSRLIPFGRLGALPQEKSLQELKKCQARGARGIKLHPRSEKFSPKNAEILIDEIERMQLPIILHTSHEPNCRPLEWEGVFKRHKRIPFVLAHAGKDAFREGIAVARRNSNVWLETSTLSYWRTSMILKEVGSKRIVFGSDFPYSHPLVERTKLDLLLSARGRKQVYFENPKKILGE